MHNENKYFAVLWVFFVWTQLTVFCWECVALHMPKERVFDDLETLQTLYIYIYIFLRGLRPRVSLIYTPENSLCKPS